MRSFLKEFWQERRRFLKFGTVGGLVFLVGTAIVFLIVDVAGHHPYGAFAIELALTLQLSFALNDVFTFETLTRSPSLALSRRWVRFHFVRLPVAAAEGILAAVLLAILSSWGIIFPHLVANALAIVTGMTASFWILWKWSYSASKRLGT